MNKRNIEYSLMCVNLEKQLADLYEKNPITKVWAAVLVNFLKQMCDAQDDPMAAYMEIIRHIQHTDTNDN